MLAREIWNRRRGVSRPPPVDAVSSDAAVEFAETSVGFGDAVAPRSLVAVVDGGEGAGDAYKARLNFSSASFRAAARRFSSRNSAPGDVARTSGTPSPSDAAAAGRVRGTLKLLTLRGLRIVRCAVDSGEGLGELVCRPSLVIWTRWKTKSVKRRLDWWSSDWMSDRVSWCLREMDLAPELVLT